MVAFFHTNTIEILIFDTSFHSLLISMSDLQDLQCHVAAQILVIGYRLNLTDMPSLPKTKPAEHGDNAFGWNRQQDTHERLILPLFFMYHEHDMVIPCQTASLKDT